MIEDLYLWYLNIRVKFRDSYEFLNNIAQKNNHIGLKVFLFISLWLYKIISKILKLLYDTITLPFIIPYRFFKPMFDYQNYIFDFIIGSRKRKKGFFLRFLNPVNFILYSLIIFIMAFKVCMPLAIISIIVLAFYSNKLSKNKSYLVQEYLDQYIEQDFSFYEKIRQNYRRGYGY